MQARVSVAIINVDTIGYSTLAALSARRQLPFPVRIIDCSRRPRQIDACKRLCDELGLQRQRWPLRSHGTTLDRLFCEADEDWLVLLDSDAEVLDAGAFTDALARAENRRAYGAGWLQRTDRAVEAGSPITLYMERPWVPFCAFAVDPVRELLAAGESFHAQRLDNDLLWLPRPLRRLIAYRRHLPGLRGLDLRPLQAGQVEIDGHRAPYIDFDTGAALHRAACDRALRFETIPWGGVRTLRVPCPWRDPQAAQLADAERRRAPAPRGARAGETSDGLS